MDVLAGIAAAKPTVEGTRLERNRAIRRIELETRDCARVIVLKRARLSDGDQSGLRARGERSTAAPSTVHSAIRAVASRWPQARKRGALRRHELV